MKRAHMAVHVESERLGGIRDELLRRIRPFCAEMPEDLFIEMVERMATLQLKYELLDARGAPE